MSDTNTAFSPMDVLLNKVSQLIKAQAAGELTGFSTENLNQVYMSLAKNEVDEPTNDLLIKMAGPDWAEGLQASEDTGEAESEAMNMAMAEVIQQIDETTQQGAVGTLASALMIACRELGWLEASRAAHDQWFFSECVAQPEG